MFQTNFSIYTLLAVVYFFSLQTLTNKHNLSGFVITSFALEQALEQNNINIAQNKFTAGVYKMQ